MHGKFCAAVAELSWFKRKAAATIFGREPLTKTWNNALEALLEVARLRPEGQVLPMGQLAIAEAYIKLGSRPEARRRLASPKRTSDTCPSPSRAAYLHQMQICPWPPRRARGPTGSSPETGS